MKKISSLIVIMLILPVFTNVNADDEISIHPSECSIALSNNKKELLTFF